MESDEAQLLGSRPHCLQKKNLIITSYQIQVFILSSRSYLSHSGKIGCFAEDWHFSFHTTVHKIEWQIRSLNFVEPPPINAVSRRDLVQPKTFDSIMLQ